MLYQFRSDHILTIALALTYLTLCNASNLSQPSTSISYLALYESTEDIAVIDGIITVKPEKSFSLWVYGKGDFNRTLISFTETAKPKGTNCDDHRTTSPTKINAETKESAKLTLKFSETNGARYYVCLKVVRSDNSSEWIHQGSEKYLTINLKEKTFELPLWIQILLVAILMILSGLFSGLNLGLMSLDPNELKIVERSGSARHKKYAKKIIPVRKHGNFLLCTLLLGNTLVNASFTILLDNLTSGIVAVVGSTLAIVIMGEIVPQSICSRYGLAVGAHTISLTKLFMVITFPLSYPVSKILDWVLGKELGNVYNKQQLLEMLKIQDEYNDLEKDEVGIISGALEYRSKIVEQVMTPLGDCFLLDEEAVLDFQTMSSIIKTGYSRIPIYSSERSNIVALLFVKDLAFVDPDDCIPLLSVIKFYNHPVHKVFYDHSLDKMLEEFKKGTSHLSVVLKVNNGGGEVDPFYECIGIVTLEDIIEEIIQAEIVDETDVYIDNASGKKVHRKHHNHDFSLFLPAPTDAQPKISAQLAFAIYQYLSTAVNVFNEELISRPILKKLIEHPGVIEEFKMESSSDQNAFLYKKGSQTDIFILLLQGRVEVTIGEENIIFEDGPFSVFGTKALICESGHIFMPDYTVKILCNIQYLKVSRSLYRSAIRASKMEKENKIPDNYQEYDEIFWTHLKKHEKQVNFLHSNNEDISSIDTASEKGTPSRKEQKNFRNSLKQHLTQLFDRKEDQLIPPDPPEDVTKHVGNGGTTKDLDINSPKTPLMIKDVDQVIDDNLC